MTLMDAIDRVEALLMEIKLMDKFGEPFESQLMTAKLDLYFHDDWSILLAQAAAGEISVNTFYLEGMELAKKLTRKIHARRVFRKLSDLEVGA
jgi:hypothetical protein